MDIQRKGPEAQLKFAIERATGSGEDNWWGTVSDIILTRHDKDLVKVLRMTPQCVPPLSLDSSIAAEDVRELKSAHAYSDALAARVAWSQLMFRWTLPHAASFMISTSRSFRRRHMPHLRNMITALLQLQECCIIK